MKIFIVEDEKTLRLILTDELIDSGHDVKEFANAKAALKNIEAEKPDIVISDMRIPGMSGLKLLERIKEVSPETHVVIMTAYSTVDTAVSALKMGAFDYICKPFNIEEIHHLIERIIEIQDIKKDNQRLQCEIAKNYSFSKFIGNSQAVKAMFNTINSVIDSNASILITGETGTGKELLANIIHFNSNRSRFPFVKVNCATLPPNNFESELFGQSEDYKKQNGGNKTGRFELADKGSIFLDDVDDIALEQQVKLIRFIEDQELEAVGSAETKKIDVRIISATKFGLKSLIDKGKFRSDLYYRLNVIPVYIPPLREHTEDIPLLADFFLQNCCSGQTKKLSEEAMNILQNYHWPGNARELKNLMERLCLTIDNDIIQAEDIPSEYLIHNKDEITNESKWDMEMILNKTEINLIKTAIARANGNKTKAAKLLGIPLSTLRSKAAKFDIK